MMNEDDYLDQVNDLKKQYDEKQSEILRGEWMIDFLKEEIVKIYGTIKMLKVAENYEACANRSDPLAHASRFFTQYLVK